MPVWTVSAWAVSFVAATLLSAVYRLGIRAGALFERELQTYEWLALALCIIAFAYGEGYRALHRKFVPAVIARAAALSTTNRANRANGITTLGILLAPLYALGLVQPNRAACLRAWLGVALIVVAVMVVRGMPEPWRAIIDASVALALAIGFVSLLLSFARWLRTAAAVSPASRP